jgi:serine phosphatase RsbU (regulator of sigma subunit)
VLSRANEILLLQDMTMVTAVCGMIDLMNGEITIANAGHPPAILLHPDGRVEMLSASGPPLGALDRPTYATASTVVEPGSMLVLYTDGLIEYGRDWEAGEARLLEAVRSVDRRSSIDPAATIMQAIFGGDAPVDDVAILTITFRETASDDHPVSADLASASARPLLDRSARTILESVIAGAYARVALAGLESATHAVESAGDRA